MNKLILIAVFAALHVCGGAGPGAGRLVCYVHDNLDNLEECTHVVYTGLIRGERLESMMKSFRNRNPTSKIVLRFNEDDKDLQSLLKSKHIQGLEVYEAHKTLNRTRIVQAVESARSAITKNGGGPLLVALPAYPELLAKYYDLRTLVKIADLMMVQTHALGLVKKMTYHPSRLSGLWDMMNTDSVVDLAIGLGVPVSKIVISLPATAQQFTLENQTLSTPGSPTRDEEPKEISQEDLCKLMSEGRWTLERDQDLSAPYAFKDTTWIAFEDASSVDVKGKYARVRGLAGLALHNADNDLATPCGPTLKTSLAKVLNSQSRAPRALVLRSLEQEILSSPSAPARALDALQLSPYRITQVVDSDGVIHSIREDTRTEFSCSRQGYFVHPRSCARFYRCVKFDQLSPEYTVFEFDCPAGLAFDSRYEVCVWPGSLPHSQACPGSSEIAPVPQTRFVCPDHEGYFADPENCRWFFACLDHGKAPLTAYEFRCPFGLGFDAEKLKCDWPWLVPACGNIARYEAEVHGYSGAALTGAAGFHGQTVDSVNIAAHQSLVSGAALDNLVGIQTGFISQADALDGNFIASQEYANANARSHELRTDLGHQGPASFVQAKNYNDENKYTSGSLILDEYRLPKSSISNANNQGVGFISKGDVANGYQANNYRASSSDNQDNSGAYIHDPTGDYGVPYRHVDAPAVPYVHDSSAYRHTNDYNDFDRSVEGGKYIQDNSGQYVNENSGSYVENNGYKADFSGTYNNDDSGKYIAGVYRGNEGLYTDYSAGKLGAANSQFNGYSNLNEGYLSGGKAFTGASHTLAAGAVNVGLVGKTTLVEDLNYNNYQQANGFGYSGAQYDQGVSIAHVGSEIYHGNNAAYVTTPTTSGIPTTATPIAVTTALPVTYKTSYVEVQPKTSIKEIFGYAQPAITHVQPTIIPIKHVTPKVEVTDYNQALDYQQYTQNNGVGVTEVGIKSEDYDYSKPTNKFEDGVTYTTAAPVLKETGYEYQKPSIKFDEVNTHIVAPTGSTLTQSFNHEISGANYDYVQQVAVEKPFQRIVAYTTGAPAATSPPIAHGYSHQTIHNVDLPKINVQVNNEYSHETPVVHSVIQQSESGYEYRKPDIKFEEVPIVSTTYKPQVINNHVVHQHEVSHVNTYTPSVQVDENSLFEYKQPEIKFEQVPVVSTTFKPQVFSHKHEVSHGNTYTPSVHVSEQSGYEYNQPKVKFVQTPIVTSTYKPQVFNHEVIHGHINTYTPSVQQSGYEYKQPKIKFEHTPLVTSTYKPQIVNHEVLHEQVNTYTPSVKFTENSGYEYKQPDIKFEQIPVIASTYKPRIINNQVVHQQEVNHVNTVQFTENSGYQYEKPENKYEQAPTYKPQVFNHQVVHQQEVNRVQIAENSGYQYEQPEIKYEQAPIVSSTYKPQVFNHQVVHQQEVNQAQITENSGYQYEQPKIKYEQAPIVSSTYKPQVFNHQVVHQQEVNQAQITKNSGYQYEQPEIKYEQAPIVSSTYKPHVSNHQVVHQQEVNHVNTYTPSVQVFENTGYQYSTPEILIKQTPIVSTTYKPQAINHQVVYKDYLPAVQAQDSGYEYSKPQIKFEETPKTVVEYTTAQPSVAYKSNAYGHQTIHKVEHNYPVSSTAKPYFDIKYEQPSVTIYENPLVQFGQKITPVVQQQEIKHTVSTYKPIENVQFNQNVYGHPEIKNVQTFDAGVSHSSHVYHDNNYKKNKDVVYVSTTPSQLIYEDHYTDYEFPKRINTYKASEYIPPQTEYASVSTQSPINVEQEQYDYKALEYESKKTVPVQRVSFSTSHEQPRFKTIDYQPQLTSTNRPIQYTPEIQVDYKADEYLPPVFSTPKPSITTFKQVYLPPVQTTPAPKFTSSEYLPPSTYKQTYLPPIQTTPAPKFTTPAPKFTTLEYLPPRDYLPPSTTANPQFKSTTEPTYKYAESTPVYKAPEYLPPISGDEPKVVNFESYNLKNLNEAAKIQYNPYQGYNDDVFVSTTYAPKRKQNIVVETAKSNLLGFGTVGPDAGLVSPAYTQVTSTYAPIKQDIVEVTPTTIPVRRTKPKIAVVTKINDFNPLLVRKLGAVCSCQSPVLVLKGRKPAVQQEYVDYDGIEYDDEGRGDIGSTPRASIKSFDSKHVTPTPIVSSSFNPIIVPDDSFYQDFQETIKPKEVYSESYISSTPTTFSPSTETIVKIRPRVKAITVAPTYKTVLVKESVTPAVIIKDSEGGLQTQSFDRYGPGGWRSRDETLQGSVDCQRAGLFRHPKQCNKFYACRWDETKQRFTLHVFNCPVQLSFDPTLGACNWPSQGPACQGDTLLTNTL